MQAGAVLITWDRLGIKGDIGAEFLSDTAKEEEGIPEHVTKFDTLIRADLELPLGRYNLGLDTGDLDTGV